MLLYATSAAGSLVICLDIPPEPKEDERAWATEPLIASHLQVPIRALDPALASPADEAALAKSRLLGGESFDEDAFADVAALMNEAAADGAPVSASSVLREQLDEPFIELRPWSYALALLVEPAWRRMLGFGLHDRASELVAGQAYDYRISGRFRRRDLKQPLHGFHAIPRGTTLPAAFALGPIALRTPAPVTVQQLPQPDDGGLGATGRKGSSSTAIPA